jgi:hypothetical protein
MLSIAASNGDLRRSTDLRLTVDSRRHKQYRLIDAPPETGRNLAFTNLCTCVSDYAPAERGVRCVQTKLTIASDTKLGHRDGWHRNALEGN